MLTCISCSNSKELPRGALPLRDSPEDDEEDNAIAVGGVGSVETPNTRQAFKALTAQIKDMALKASGAYRHCKPCAGSAAAHSQRHHRYHHGYSFADSGVASGSERFHHSYRRACSSTASTPRLRRGGSMSSGDATPSVSTRTDFLAGDEEGAEKEMVDGGIDEEEEKEWVAQVEPGVLISFLSLPQGGNELKRIRFSREMFTKWRAQRWWAENYEKVMELYNVQKFNRQAVPLPSTPSFDDENSKEDNLATPQFNKDHLPHGMQRPLMGSGAVGQPNYHEKAYRQDRYLGHHCYDSVALTSTPKLSSISGAKTEISSIDASVRTSSSPEEVDRSSELSVSVSNASEQEREWVEEDEPGIYITVRALPGGKRELCRVRFSRERFSEMHARLWWEENRARIHDQYL